MFKTPSVLPGVPLSARAMDFAFKVQIEGHTDTNATVEGRENNRRVESSSSSIF